MKPEIKQRIEQIKAGQVPDGYKRTRAGIMPYDWCCDREYRAKDIFKSITNKKHNGEFDVLSATQDKGVIPREQVDINIKYNKDSVAGYKKVDKGDFVISLRSFQGGIEYSEYEGLVSPAYTVLKPIIPICDKYYKYYFKTSDYINRLNIGTYGIRDGKQIGYEDFGDMVIHYPPLAEQEKIAKVLSTQDRIIELYQRKIEELQKMKKVYLSKMFPKKGENASEWRFSQFNDSWEQREAVDIADYSKGNGYSKSDLTENGTPIILYGRLYTKYQFAIDEVDTFATPKDGSIYSQGNEVIIPASGETAEDIARASAVEKSGILLGGDLNILRPFNFINPLFLALTISNGEPQKELAKKAQGKSVVHIHNSDIQEVTVSFPTRAEQDRIVAVFRSLDNLITLHQRKLEETKKYKKALMQLLLTGIVRCE